MPRCIVRDSGMFADVIVYILSYLAYDSVCIGEGIMQYPNCGLHRRSTTVSLETYPSIPLLFIAATTNLLL